MQSGIYTIQNQVGLHARPAALFVQTAAKFQSKIKVRNATRGTPFVDAKSILMLLPLQVRQGHEVEITTDGPDEQSALEAIASLIASNFAE